MNYQYLFHNILHGSEASYEIEFEEQAPSLEYRGPENDMFLVQDEEAQLILMHRDVHFASSFETMLKYYEHEDAPGIQQDISLHKINELYDLEKRLKKNIAPYILSGKEAEIVAHFRALYQQWQELAEIAPKGSPEAFIADLFLSDGEWEELVKEYIPTTENPFIEILTNDEFQNALCPGFGTVPQAAARILGKMKTEKACRALFFSLGKGSFDLEEEILHSLRSMGDMACEFCIQHAQSSDPERALLALHAFVPNEKVQECAVSLLEKGLNEPYLRSYCIDLLEGLVDRLKPRLSALVQKGAFTKEELLYTL